MATLLGRHKSWVCRRLALAERLADAVACDVRGGLVTTTVAREVARLPRGNQPEIAAAIRREGLGSHDAARLVTLFAKTSGTAQQRYLLEHPREALEANGPRLPFVSHDPRLGPLRVTEHELFVYAADLSVLARHEKAPRGHREPVVNPEHRPSKMPPPVSKGTTWFHLPGPTRLQT